MYANFTTDDPSLVERMVREHMPSCSRITVERKEGHYDVFISGPEVACGDVPPDAPVSDC